ncbi:hypothetical protein EV648_107409 [Kribbella sp. VKM Ac-2568]|nr:hypothetical protein EV648_107409 [Kribbella sp. VKM Ac-2568]
MSTPAYSAEATKPPDSPNHPGNSRRPYDKNSMGSSIEFTATLAVLVGLALFGWTIFAGLFTDDGDGSPRSRRNRSRPKATRGWPTAPRATPRYLWPCATTPSGPFGRRRA